MDLRMIKTRQQIKAAFLSLREKHMPEKIKVKDICRVAMINKTTFYNHYPDSMALSDEIDEHAIDRALQGFSERDRLLADPRAYVIGLLQALERESDNLKTVFRGKQDVLCAKLEERLYRLCDGMAGDFENGVRLSFSIGGFVRVVRDYLFGDKPYRMDQLIEHSTDLIDLVVHRVQTYQLTEA